MRAAGESCESAKLVMPEIRVLTPEERQLAADPGGIQWPEDSLVLGAFDVDGRLVGRMALIALPHIEGTWAAKEL